MALFHGTLPPHVPARSLITAASQPTNRTMRKSPSSTKRKSAFFKTAHRVPMEWSFNSM